MRTACILVAPLVWLAAGCSRQASSGGPGLPTLATRAVVTDRADGCDAQATLVYVGIDRDHDGSLADGERHEPPMVFCTGEPITTEIIDTPANAYCPRPNRTIEISRPGKKSQLVVCFDEGAHAIASTYAVYAPY